MVTITIKTDNAAFQDGNGHFEIARILREIAEHAEFGLSLPKKILDINGNVVGGIMTDGEAI